MPSGDFNECRDTSFSFLNAAEWCCRDVDSLLAGNMYPGVTNAAFSCELGMKALMIINSSTNEFPRGHDLRILYDQLPNKFQKEINESYRQSQENLPSLDVFLDENRNAFNDWRYAFENGVKINLSALFAFANAIKECLKKLSL